MPMRTANGIFRTEAGEALYRAAYHASLALWTVKYEPLDVHTRFGRTHILACGPEQGTPLVLLPAMAFSATMWYSVAPALARRFRCYAAEFPADLGLSALTESPADRVRCAEWLREVLDGLEIGRACLMGASYGGFLALNYAIEEPLRVRSLVLLSPAGCFVRLSRGACLRLLLSTTLPGAGTKRLLRWVFDGRFALDSPVVRQLLTGAQAARPRMRVRPAVFHELELRNVYLPLYLLLGERDVAFSPRRAAARARRLLPNGTIEIVPRAGHLLSLERPGAVIERVLPFLETTRDWQPHTGDQSLAPPGSV
jgi:pimeloyl-ACP methyl ester carboxylesterase